ncbi:MAG: hypothetical protein LLG24_06905 [Actinomycetia bacterium]|nr:hypothetical protein [Actinomycetes bacterium]
MLATSATLAGLPISDRLDDVLAGQEERARYLHPRVGADILSRLPDDDYITHPYSRILAVADRYERLTAASPHGYGLTPDQAVIQLLRDVPSLLDETFTRLLVRALGVFPIGCLVRMSDHSVGVVCAPGVRPMMPRVRIVYDASGLEVSPAREIDTQDADVTIVEIIAPENLAVTVSDHL